MKRFLTVLAALLISLLLAGCNNSEQQAIESENAEFKIALQEVNTFPLVSMYFDAETKTSQSALQSFRQELSNQHLQPTGPLLMIFRSKGNPSLEIASPVAENTMVKSPLFLGEWRYPVVFEGQHLDINPSVPNLHQELIEFAKASNFPDHSTIVVRLIEDESIPETGKTYTAELWIPLPSASLFSD